MGNLTKVERSLNNIEKHLKIIADSMGSDKDVHICAQFFNLFYQVEGVIFIEAKKVFSGLSFSVYLKGEVYDSDETIQALGECEQRILQKYGNNIAVDYHATMDDVGDE